jgi:hypothetical protein
MYNNDCPRIYPPSDSMGHLVFQYQYCGIH